MKMNRTYMHKLQRMLQRAERYPRLPTKPSRSLSITLPTLISQTHNSSHSRSQAHSNKTIYHRSQITTTVDFTLRTTQRLSHEDTCVKFIPPNIVYKVIQRSNLAYA